MFGKRRTNERSVQLTTTNRQSTRCVSRVYHVTRSIQHPRTGNFVYSQLAGRRHVTSAIFFRAILSSRNFVARQNRKVWLTPNTGGPRSNAAKTRNPLKFAGVPETTGPISAASGPKFTILCEHVEEVLLLKHFFFLIVDTFLNCEDIARQSCAMMPRWRFFDDFLRPVFVASSAQHVSDLRLKFALRPHLVCKYCRHPICDG